MFQVVYKEFIKAFLIILATLGLSSCSPVYKIGYDLIPPKTQSGLVCVTGCQSKLKQCDVGCTRQFRQCGYEADLKAKRLLPALLKEYPQKLEVWLNAKEAYQRELDFYEFQVEMAETHRDLYLAGCDNEKDKKAASACRNSYSGHSYTDLDRPTFDLPRPIKPTQESESKRIKKATCSTNCGCDSSYRACFSSCGGIVTSKKICIKNCPK